MERFLKRAILIIFSFFVIFFSACGQDLDVKDRFTVPMRFSASTKGSDSNFLVNIKDGFCDIEFKEPGVLCGALLHLEQEKSRFTVGAFSYAIDENEFPAMTALVKSVRLLALREADGIEEENGIKYTIDETVILVYYDKDTDDVTGIRTEELGRVFEFALSDLESYEAQSDGTGQP